MRRSNEIVENDDFNENYKKSENFSVIGCNPEHKGGFGVWSATFFPI